VLITTLAIPTLASRCGWTTNRTHAFIDTFEVSGWANFSHAFVSFTRPTCKASRRWAHLSKSSCRDVPRGLTRGHLIPRVLTGPAFGTNCALQSKPVQDFFASTERNLRNCRYGNYSVRLYPEPCFDLFCNESESSACFSASLPSFRLHPTVLLGALIVFLAL